MTEQKKTARIAGLWYAAFILLGAFAMAFADEKLSIAGDAAATIESIKASMTLFCSGLAAYIAGYICFIFSVNALFRVFKSENYRLALLMKTFVIAGTAIALICKFAQLAAVVATSPQSDTAARLISVYTNGTNAAGVFWGLWLLPLGLLILQSKLIPKAIGILLFIACAGHLADCAIFFLAPPPLPEPILPALYATEITGEFALVLWLIIKGTNPPAHATKEHQRKKRDRSD